jgi:hypothetical protein
MYSSDLPSVLRFSIQPAVRTEAHVRTLDNGSIDFSKVSTVWYRRVGFTQRPAGICDVDWQIAERESEYWLRGLRQFLSLQVDFWVNPLVSREAALSKLVQLQHASRIGFTIPATLISNDPSTIRQFVGGFPDGDVVFKLAYQNKWVNSDGARALFTTPVSKNQLTDDLSITACPATYQARVDKRYELRVTCIDEMCFAAKINSQDRASTANDWRADFTSPLSIEHYELPSSVKSKCTRLLRSLGLVFGCIDLIVTNQGDYVFLEVNEMGQFLWVEELLPSSRLLQAFVTLLVRRQLRDDSEFVGGDWLSFNAFKSSPEAREFLEEDATCHASYEPPRIGFS